MAGASGIGGEAADAAKNKATDGVGKAAGEAGKPSLPGAGGPPGMPGAEGGGAAANLAKLAEPGGAAKMALGAATAGAQKLGAGGTSEASPDMADGGMADDAAKAGSAGKVAAAGAAAAAPGAAQLGMILMFVQWLKMMMMMAVAALMNAINAFIGVLVAIFKAVVGFFVSIGAGISAAVGGAVSVVTATVSAFAMFLTILAGGAAATVATVNSYEIAKHEGSIQSCIVDAQAAYANIGEPSDTDETTERNAETIYSVFKAWGMPDENIAGILGNWQAESGIDPTGVETIYNERFQIGPRKQSAWDAEFDVNAVDAAYGNRFPGVRIVGIGLGQWSNDRNPKLLAYADRVGESWYSLNTQLGFMISNDEGGNADVVKDMIANSKGTPGEAAIFFHHEWERSADGEEGLQNRRNLATAWMGKFGGWRADNDLANSILEQAETSVDGANTERAKAIKASCIDAVKSGGGIKEGGMNLEEATVFMEEYLDTGEAFLQAKYGGGGPGDCGYGKADNCVGFSVYFVNKYTTFTQYPMGNGVDTAGSVASMTDRSTQSDPCVYCVGSGPGTGPEGHTLVVLGIEGDDIIIGEASCGSNHAGTRAHIFPKSYFTDNGWVFTDVSDLMLEGGETNPPN